MVVTGQYRWARDSLGMYTCSNRQGPPTRPKHASSKALVAVDLHVRGALRPIKACPYNLNLDYLLMYIPE